MRAKLLAQLGAFLFLLFLVANAKTSLPFVSGERLEYEMKWGFFPVGYATMEVSQNESSEGNNSFLVNFSVRTNSFADTFYKVRTSITSQLDSSFSSTLSYTKSQREGSTRREIQVDYDYEKGECRYVLNGSNPQVLSIPGPCFDPLSIAYYFRVHPIEPDSIKELPVCDGKKFREVLVRSGSSKMMSLPAGKISVIETVPAMENLGGVFNKSPDGLLKVWYSNDDRRIPVKVSSKVVVGSFTATLVKANPPLEIKRKSR